MDQDQANATHPFERTLGPGPYRYVGFFEINIQAGQMGRPYINSHLVHPRFVSGAGTCAHCGHAIFAIVRNVSHFQFMGILEVSNDYGVV
jgi:hypothetical protein